jgi:hypothetical protein
MAPFEGRRAGGEAILDEPGIPLLPVIELPQMARPLAFQKLCAQK